jgi:HK97 family phage prohead protease
VIKHKLSPGGVKDTDPEAGVVTGYASTFGNVDLVGDIVQPGAFNRTLASRSEKVKVLWQHSAFDPIGKPVTMRADEHGLYTETRLSETTLGRDVLKLIQDEVVTDMSIGYDVLDFAWDEEGHFLIREAKLYEYSFVTFPANELANVTGLKGEARDTITTQMQRLERSLSTGEWHSEDFAEALTLQLKTWQSLLTNPEEPHRLAPEGAHAPAEVLTSIRDHISLVRASIAVHR